MQSCQIFRNARSANRRPRRSAAGERDELAAPNHSITSSARASSAAGTVRSHEEEIAGIQCMHPNEHELIVGIKGDDHTTAAIVAVGNEVVEIREER
jgi:hypothetical protein